MTITISFFTMKRLLWSAAIVGVMAAGAFGVTQISQAQEEEIEEAAVARIQFPVAELGNCADKDACKTYCDRPGNRRPCFEFAKKYGLMKQEKVRKIEKRLSAIEQVGGGPGGCQSEQTCEEYCSDVAHMRECITFAKAHDIMETHELEEAEKVQAAVDRGAALPGGCRSKETCEAYCSNPEHMEECVAFAEAAGFMKQEELAEAKRILPLMQRGETPGGCRSRAQCEAYCENPDHTDECVAFAEKAGLIDQKELEMIKKTGGRGPGGCRGRFECEQYCENPEHAEACFAFAEQHGLIPPQELERIKKAGGPQLLKDGGPGGCRGKRACEEFCRNPEHQEACFQFAVEKGLIPPEEVERIKSFGGPQAFKGPGGCMGPRECEAYCSQEGHMEECMEFFGGGRGAPPPEFQEEEGREDEERFDDEFEDERPMRRVPPAFGIPGFSGPGDCKGPKECFEFCKKPENGAACLEFVPSGGPGRGGMPGPGDEDEFLGPPPPDVEEDDYGSGGHDGDMPELEEGFEDGREVMPPELPPEAHERTREKMQLRFEGERGRQVEERMREERMHMEERMRIEEHRQPEFEGRPPVPPMEPRDSSQAPLGRRVIATVVAILTGMLFGR